MIPFKCSPPKVHLFQCQCCGVEWHGSADEEGCPLARLEEELFPFQDSLMGWETIREAPVLLM